MVTISLNLIMKNESKVILRMLESVYTLIDRYDIVDTGSMDNTKELVINFFKEKNIPGEIYDRPFDNFADSRNYAIKMLDQKADYGFIIDSDEQLILPENFNLESFKNTLGQYDKANVTVDHIKLTYARNAFFKTSKPFYWKGKVHNVLMCDKHITDITFSDIKIHSKPDGSTWEKGKEKYSIQAKILLEEFKLNNSPRDLFYLAQSHRDAGELDAALYFYRERVKRLDGFYEERFYSQFMVGHLCTQLNESTDQIVVEYLYAHELDPLRGEPILNLIILLADQGFKNTARLFSSYAVEKYHKKSPYPKRVLFLDSATYESKILAAHNSLI